MQQLRVKLGRDESWCPPSGWYMFGLSVPAVIALVERLPGSLRCRAYTHRFFMPNKVCFFITNFWSFVNIFSKRRGNCRTTSAGRYR
jgi:hypothetical protein